MPTYPFSHDGPVYLVTDDKFEVAYYSYQKRKFKRVREIDKQSWEDTTRQQICHDTFWLVVGFIERSHWYAKK